MRGEKHEVRTQIKIIIIQESNKPMKILLALNMKGKGRRMKRGRSGLGGGYILPQRAKQGEPTLPSGIFGPQTQ